MSVTSDFDIASFFPGYEVEDECQIERITMLSNSLRGLKSAKIMEYEKQVLQKYTKDGAITAFKGTNEIKNQQHRIKIQKRMKEFKDAISQTQNSINALDASLALAKEKQYRSAIHCQDVANDIEALFEEQDISLCIPRYTSLQIQNGQYTNFIIPKDSHLMLSPRFRTLTGLYYEHGQTIEDCNGQISVMENERIMEADKLSKYQSEELKLMPQFKKAEDDNFQIYAEMNIVAKQRSRVYQSQKAAKQRAIEELTKKSAVVYVPDLPPIEPKKYYIPSITKLSNTKEQEIELEKIKIRKKNEALKSLREEIATKMKGRRPAKILNASEKIAKQQRTLKRQIEKRTNDIISKILTENEKRNKHAYPEPTPRKHSKKEPVVKVSAPTNIDNFEPAIKTKDFVPSRRPSSHNSNNGEVEFVPLQRIRLPLPLMRPKLSSYPKLANICTSFRVYPQHVIFKDYEPSKVYTQTVLFTNISTITNQFKVTNISLDICQFVKVVHAPSTKVGMGGCCEVQLIFSPPVDFSEELERISIEFETSLGEKLEIQVSLANPKCIPVVSCVGGTHVSSVILNNERGQYTNYDKLVGKSHHSIDNIAKMHDSKLVLDFGVCVLGTTKGLWVDLSNNGFNAVSYQVDFFCPSKSSPGDLNNGVNLFQVRKEKGEMNGYSTSRFFIDFCPTYTADWRPTKMVDDDLSLFTRKGRKLSSMFQITYSDSQLLPVQIICEGIALDPPLFADRSIIDFNQCLVDTLYHDQLNVHNLHNSALRFWLDFSPLKIVPTHGGSFRVCIPSLGTLDLSTSFGFVQPCKALPVWFTLKLSPEAYEAHEMGKKPFILPFAVKYVESQTRTERRVPILLTGTITDHKVMIWHSDGNTIDFGETSLLESKNHDIVVSNLSQLKQIVRINSTDQCISLLDTSENHGEYMVLEPLQEISRTLQFRPELPKPYNISLTCQTTKGYISRMECYGGGTVPPLCFSSSCVEFETTAFGSKQYRNLQIQRTFLQYPALKQHLRIDSSWSFEFGLPIIIDFQTNNSQIDKNSESQNSGQTTPANKLKSEFENASPRQLETILNHVVTAEPVDSEVPIFDIWPSCGQISQGEFKAGIQLTFCPPKAPKITETYKAATLSEEGIDNSESNAMLFKNSRSKVTKSSTVPVSEVKKPQQQMPILTEPQVDSRPSTPLTPFRRKLLSAIDPVINWILPCRISQSAVNRIGAEPLSSSSSIESPSSTIYLKMITPFSSASFVIMDADHVQINFGKVALDQKQVRLITVKNISADDIVLKIKGLNPFGPFYLARAIRPLGPGQTFQFHFGFLPDVENAYFSIIEISHGSTTQELKLIGEGVLPAIQLDIANEINFGNVLVGDISSKTFKVTNTSAIAIECVLTMFNLSDSLRHNVGTQNLLGRNPFTVSILRASILPGTSVDVSIKFSPDLQSDLFLDELKIEFAGQVETTRIRLSGRSWGTTLCLMGYDDHPESFVSFRRPSAIQLQETLMKTYNVKSLRHVNLDEHALIQLLGDTNTKKENYYVTLDFKWIKVLASKLEYMDCAPDMYYWRIEPRDITVASLKPHSIKLDTKKIECEYTIEESSESFAYNPVVCDYVMTTGTEKKTERPSIKFIADSKKGSIEYGGTKSIKLIAVDTIRASHESSIEIHEKGDAVPLVKESDKKSSKIIQEAVIPMPEKEISFYRQKMQETELTEPIYVETVIKIKMKGGYRNVEPKGNLSENEFQIFYVLARADPANIE